MREIRFHKDQSQLYFTLPGDVRVATNYPSQQSQGSLLRLVKQVYERGLKDGGLATAQVTEAPAVESPLPFSVAGIC